MKKFASLFLTVALLATTLTVFAVPASAEETKTAEDYLIEAAQLKNAGQYNEAAIAYKTAADMFLNANDSIAAADAYVKAGEVYDQLASSYELQGDIRAAAETFIKAAEVYINAGRLIEEAGIGGADEALSSATLLYGKAANLYDSVLYDYAAAADVYIICGKHCESREKWADAAKSFDKAAEWYSRYLGDHVSVIDAYMKAGECYEKAELFSSAGNAFDKAASQYKQAGDSASATNAYKKAGAAYMKYAYSGDAESFTKAGDSYLNACDYAAAANAYMKAGEYYLKTNGFSGAADYFSKAASAARKKANESTGSTLSEGSLTIIVGVAGIAVGLVGGLLLGRKKKKPALAEGENTDEE